MDLNRFNSGASWNSIELFIQSITWKFDASPRMVMSSCEL
jgi:hypothetical protein